MTLARPAALLCVPLLALGVSACASTTSSSSFKGEPHEVAQAIVSLQSEAAAGEAQKICEELLSSSVTARLSAGRSPIGGCTQALKSQLTGVDSPELTIGSIQLHSTSASATVKSVYAGKSRISTLSLVKEDGKWKISKLG
jgi:Putative lumazine-binding